MSTSLDVARYFVHLASSEDEPEPLTHLRIQKLVYYVQGWSLAIFGKPLFDDRIEAWQHGPVACGLYQSLKLLCNAPLPSDFGYDYNLSSTDKSFIEGIWRTYRVHSAWGLRAKTHNERPWLDARGDLPVNQSSNSEITHEALRSFFSEEMTNLVLPELSPARAYQALASIEKGRASPHEEVFARLKNSKCPTF